MIMVFNSQLLLVSFQICAGEIEKYIQVIKRTLIIMVTIIAIIKKSIIMVTDINFFPCLKLSLFLVSQDLQRIKLDIDLNHFQWGC